MRSLAIVCALLLTGCASLPPPPTQSMSVLARHPTATLERPWLMPIAQDEVTLFDTRTLQKLRELDETQALNQNGNGRRVRHPGMWAGIGAGAFIGTVLVVDAAQDTTEDIFNNVWDDFFDCFFEAFFGGDSCDSDD